MNRLPLVPLILILFLAVAPSIAQVQAAPSVLFIESRDLNTAELTNVGAAGVSQLADMFRQAGARVQRFDISQEIPEGTQVVVLVRPLRRFQAAHIARLLLYLNGGGNLLVAADPENYNLSTANVNTQLDRTGLVEVLDGDYGLLIQHSFLVEPWFSLDSINALSTNYSLSYPDVVQHPVTEPLAAYRLPVWIWGARHVRVEPLSVHGFGVPLLFTETAYGETREDIFRSFRTETEAPTGSLEIDLDSDFLGRLNVAALAENDDIGSRVAVVGDSEVFQNGYGLVANAGAPRYPGDLIFAQRLVNWLLEIPEEQWPALPDGFTWLTMDGNSADWSPFQAAASKTDDPIGDVPAASTDIQEVVAFSDDVYAYFSVRTSVAPSVTNDVQFKLESGATLVFHGGSAVLLDSTGASTDVSDAAISVGDVIEVRVPLRVVPLTLRVEDVCLQSDDTTDCIGEPVGAPLVESRAPFDFALSSGPVAMVASEQPINLRSRPGTDAPQVAGLTNGIPFAAIGRNEEGTWVNVQNGRYAGWVATSLVAVNGDVSLLPMTNPAISQ